jgi:hypothetical protein
VCAYVAVTVAVTWYRFRAAPGCWPLVHSAHVAQYTAGPGSSVGLTGGAAPDACVPRPDELEGVAGLPSDGLRASAPSFACRCFTIEEGYPVRFLSSYPSVEQDSGKTSNIAAVSLGGAPIISKAGLFEDWLVWSLISCGVLYLLAPSVSRTRARLGSQPTD